MTAPRASRVTVRVDRWLDAEQSMLGFRLTVRVAGQTAEVVEVPIAAGVDTMAEVRRQRDRLEAKWLPNGGS